MLVRSHEKQSEATMEATLWCCGDVSASADAPTEADPGACGPSASAPHDRCTVRHILSGDLSNGKNSLYVSILASMCSCVASRAVKARGRKGAATRGRVASAAPRRKGVSCSGSQAPPASPVHGALEALLSAASAAQQVQSPCMIPDCEVHILTDTVAIDAHIHDFNTSPSPSAQRCSRQSATLQVPQLLSKACHSLARVFAQAGCPAAALLALHDCRGAAVRHQFAAVVRGKQLALARQADVDGAAPLAAAVAGLHAVDAHLRPAWRDLQQLPMPGIEVRSVTARCH